VIFRRGVFGLGLSAALILGARLGPTAPAVPELTVLESQVAALESESQELQRTLLTRGRAYVRLVGLGLLPVGGGIDALVTHATHVELLKTALERAIERQKIVAEQLETLKKQRESLRAREASAGVTLPEINDVGRGEAAILAARERELAFQRAFGGSAGNDPHTTVYGSMAHIAPDVQRFVDLKGRLPIPVEGRAEVREVEAEDARGPGLDFRTNLGTDALAVYAGRVAMVGEYGGLGLGVLVEHDSGYSTLYGSLTQARVEVGQRVNAGDALGVLAKAPGGSRLYFEIRRDVDRLQPAEWVGLQGAR
jgi:septal ring factor EnvC (AmiA/AmiB activator)